MEKKSWTESKLWKFINYAGNVISLNLAFLICCLPIVTIGPALCGLFSGVRYLIKDDDWFPGFKAGFKENFIRSAVAGVLSTAFMAYVLLNFNAQLNAFLEGGSVIPTVIYGIMGLIPAMLTASLWALNIYIPYDTLEWIKTTVSICFKAPGPVLLCAVLFLLPVILVLYFTYYVYAILIVFLAVYFVLAAFVATLFYKRPLVELLMDYRREHPQTDR